MQLSDQDQAMLSGEQGDAKRIALEGLVQLGEAFGAEDMVDIGYAHIHAGMALYLHDVQLMEELADQGAKMSVPVSSNIANADMQNWRQTGAPENLVQLQRRAESAHRRMGSSCSFTCTPYWCGYWPTWNMHMASIESGVTVLCNSVFGARSNRDGFFAVYAAITGRYPRFGLHLDRNRRGTHRVTVEARPEDTTDFTALGFHIGRLVQDGVPAFEGFYRLPDLDELDGLGVGLATSGGVAMFILPGVTPPVASLAQAFEGRRASVNIGVGDTDIAVVYDELTTGAGDFDIVHLGCPHASLEEMKSYAELLEGKRVNDGAELWITTSRWVRKMAHDAGILAVLERTGAKIISDTCPISCHFARTTSPDPQLGLRPPQLSGMVVDSAKQAKYVRDMIGCDTLLTSTARAIETAITGKFIPRY
jgi:predicted aconitase